MSKLEIPNPATLEYELLQQSLQTMVKDQKKNNDTLAAANKNENKKENNNETETPALVLDRFCRAFAMQHLRGYKTVSTIYKWFTTPHEFICDHCLQLADGLPVPEVVAADKDMWIITGRKFGSVGCSRRYSMNKHGSFWQECAGLLDIMLIRVYGFTGDVTSFPLAPNRESLPCFQSKMQQKKEKNNEEKNNDGIVFHKTLMNNTILKLNPQLPPPKLDFLRSTLLIDTFYPEKPVGVSYYTLRSWLGANFYLKK